MVIDLSATARCYEDAMKLGREQGQQRMMVVWDIEESEFNSALNFWKRTSAQHGGQRTWSQMAYARTSRTERRRI
jgi:hypothetical protein